MHIKPSHIKPQYGIARRSAPVNQAGPETDSVTLEGDKGDGDFALGAMGALFGGVGVGVPASMVMGGIKLAMGSHLGLGIGLGVAGAAVGALSVPISFMPAAMSTDNGASAGINGYFVGAGLTTAAAGLAIFS